VNPAPRITGRERPVLLELGRDQAGAPGGEPEAVQGTRAQTVSAGSWSDGRLGELAVGAGSGAAGTDSAGVAGARPVSITTLGPWGTGCGLKMRLGTMAMTSINKIAAMTRR
jgi:hypothetical protein